MPKTYTRLTEDERYPIYEGTVHGISHRVIARQPGRIKSVIARNIRKDWSPEQIQGRLKRLMKFTRL